MFDTEKDRDLHHYTIVFPFHNPAGNWITFTGNGILTRLRWPVSVKVRDWFSGGSERRMLRGKDTEGVERAEARKTENNIFGEWR
ncbi:hypothetical protein FKM82_013984 [Ascaphus truei]